MKNDSWPQALIIVTGCIAFLVVVGVWVFTERDVPPGLQVILAGIFGGALAVKGIADTRKHESESKGDPPDKKEGS